MRVGFCVNRSRKKGLRSYRNHWECLMCSPRLWTHDEREKEEEEEQRTGEGPPACLRGGKPDTAYDFTNNVSFCTTDSGRVYLISKKWTLIEPQLYVGGGKKMWISKHTATQELQVSLILFSPLSSVCSLTERGGLLAHWEICKDNEKSGHDGRFSRKKRDCRTSLPGWTTCCPASVVAPRTSNLHDKRRIYAQKSC